MNRLKIETGLQSWLNHCKKIRGNIEVPGREQGMVLDVQDFLVAAVGAGDCLAGFRGGSLRRADRRAL